MPKVSFNLPSTTSDKFAQLNCIYCGQLMPGTHRKCENSTQSEHLFVSAKSGYNPNNVIFQTSPTAVSRRRRKSGSDDSVTATADLFSEASLEENSPAPEKTSYPSPDFSSPWNFCTSTYKPSVVSSSIDIHTPAETNESNAKEEEEDAH